MGYVRSGNLVGPVLAGLLALAACAPAGKPADQSMFTTDLTGLELRANALPTIVYVRPDAPPLSEFNRFIVDTAQVNYTDPGIEELTPEQVGWLQEAFHSKMVNELTRAGYEVGTRAEAGTLRISFVISGLKAPGSAVPYGIGVGEVTIEAIFRDAVSHRINVVVLRRTQGSPVFNPSLWSTFADVDMSFDLWTRGIRETIDTAHGS